MSPELEAGLAWQAARAYHFASTGCQPSSCPHDVETIVGPEAAAWATVARVVHDAALAFYGLRAIA